MTKKIFITLFVVVQMACAYGQATSFPYIGGRTKFDDDFGDHLQKSIKPNDSAAIYFVRIFQNKSTHQVQFEVSGSKRSGAIFSNVTDFFSSVSQNWDSDFFKKHDLVLPVFIRNEINPIDEVKVSIDWPHFKRGELMISKTTILTEPFDFETIGPVIDN